MATSMCHNCATLKPVSAIESKPKTGLEIYHCQAGRWKCALGVLKSLGALVANLVFCNAVTSACEAWHRSHPHKRGEDARTLDGLLGSKVDLSKPALLCQEAVFAWLGLTGQAKLRETNVKC